MDTAGGPLLRLSRGLVALAGLAAIALFIGLFARRLDAPLELGNVEGMMMDHVARLEHGQPLYVAPGLGFIPLAYMPLYPLVVATLARGFGISMTLGRLVGGLSALGVAALAFAAIRRATGSLAFGLAGAGMFLMGEGVTRGAYDIVRPDSLMLLLAFGGLTLLRVTTSRFGAGVAAVVLAAAFFTKQHAALFGVAALVHLALDDRRRLAAFALTYAVATLGVYALLAFTLGPWFDFYVREIPSRWSTLSRTRVLDYARVGVLALLGIPSVAVLVRLALPAPAWRGRDAIWLWAAVAGIGTGLLATLDPYAYFHVLMPTIAGIAIAGPIALHELGVRLAAAGAPRRAWLAVDTLALLAFLPLLYPVHTLLPRASARRARAILDERLAVTAGPLLVPSHGWLTTSAGRGSGLCILALDDLVRARGNRLLARDPNYLERVFDALRRGPNRPTLFTDQRLEQLGDVSRSLWSSLAPHYRLVDSLDRETADALRPVGGNHGAPRYIYRPIEARP